MSMKQFFMEAFNEFYYTLLNERVCKIHWIVLAIIVCALFLTIAFRRKAKTYVVVLVSVAIISIILAFLGDCCVDWVFAVAGTIVLEVFDIIFIKIYNKENVVNE